MSSAFDETKVPPRSSSSNKMKSWFVPRVRTSKRQKRQTERPRKRLKAKNVETERVLQSERGGERAIQKRERER